MLKARLAEDCMVNEQPALDDGCLHSGLGFIVVQARGDGGG